MLQGVGLFLGRDLRLYRSAGEREWGLQHWREARGDALGWCVRHSSCVQGTEGMERDYNTWGDGLGEWL